jgi:hydroxypyruvate reductase
MTIQPGPPRFADFRRHVDGLVSAALTAADPDAAVARFLRRRGHTLHIGPPADASVVDLTRGRCILIAAGKAAVPMTRAALRALGDHPVEGVVITKRSGRNWASEAQSWPLALHLAGHPVTNDAGLKASTAVAELVSSATGDDTIICLISGGASALLAQPLLPLEELRRLVEYLMRSGCTIQELNTVRRALDKIKSGGLARMAYPATVYGLILSDVVGNSLRDIGSGPTVTTDDTISTVVSTLGRYDIARQMERAEWERLADGLKQVRAFRAKPLPPVYNRIVADGRDAALAAMVRANQLGFVGQVLTSRMEGEARVIGRLAAGIARDIAPGQCFILAGETTVTVRGKGHGGRNQEAALAAAMALDGAPRAVVACVATDGEDGPTTAAGAVVTGDTAGLGAALGLSPAAYLADNNSHAFFRQLDEAPGGRPPHLVTTGPTGTNVNDLLFILTYGA